jgi:hypothetical protein
VVWVLKGFRQLGHYRSPSFLLQEVACEHGVAKEAVKPQVPAAVKNKEVEESREGQVVKVQADTPFRGDLEEARLKALRDLRVLDTPAEARFDNITKLLQGLFQVRDGARQELHS